ncbi:hypothetical protein PR202_ga31394 [Eleusine coracana subsp. coracana]|uniref:GH18 domain-containing protein n=1 Tax=Eleusine coracana subsp. coracana TaxID=191504 RepID=A0AAV5DS42_ELECO|nr:hypothetical protein QOZ80_9AG0681020 [Eleusine coracana subsp. coracana]GJN13061.1 hypothetical protein PR202_ga31394 [Eleusine coracana subsp. coracana]
MALWRTNLKVALAILLSVLICFLAVPSSATPADNRTGQVTVFWGRHKDEGSLREACDSDTYTTVIISFLNVSGHSRYDLDLSGHPLTGIGNDIKHCQHVGIAVSLSITFDGSKNTLPTNQSALNLSDHIWNAYLGSSGKGHLDVLARELAKRSIRGKTLHLTATPRCNFPGSLTTGIFERIHVRYYGDHAGNCDNWDDWADGYPSSRIFLGLPASPEAVKEGYLYPKSLYYGILPVAQMSANYGGVMIWDRFYDRASSYSSCVNRWA